MIFPPKLSEEKRATVYETYDLINEVADKLNKLKVRNEIVILAVRDIAYFFGWTPQELLMIVPPPPPTPTRKQAGR